MGSMDKFTFYLVIFSIKSTYSVFTLCETLMEMAEYVKNKKLRKCLRPKVTPIERLTKDTKCAYSLASVRWMLQQIVSYQ